MKKNIHAIDRLIRLLFAALVAILYFTGTITGTFAVVLALTAAILAVTAVVNFCPIYYALGISTLKKSARV